MSSASLMPCGQFRTTYGKDQTIFPTPNSARVVLLSLIVLCFAPLFLGDYALTLCIQIGYFGIAALGLNILVGCTGQISLGHAALFGFGAFASTFINSHFGVPIFFSIPLAGALTTAVGMIVGVPAARLKGLYLAIATLAAQVILQDFFARAGWFTGGSGGASAAPFDLFGWNLGDDKSYFYVVLVYTAIMYVVGANILRTRDGRAFIALRDHYLSAEMMGISLSRYRILAFGVSSFYAGVAGALYGHHLGYISAEGFTIFLSVQFLGMIIIGGLGSVMGSLMGTVFMVLLPEAMQVVMREFATFGISSGLTEGLAYLKEMAIGLAIILFLIFEPDGLAHRWRLIKAYWKLYPFSY